ncbi:hypothetical protein ACHQM5_008889 [Ranunculus cassubicifolius]
MGNDYMRDLLQQFAESKHPVDETGVKSEETTELNLGLSLGGVFGGKATEKGSSTLFRSSSSSSAFFTTLTREEVVDLPPLTRTSSLPSETLEETRKRKGVMEMREMEVMKSRLEKQRRYREGLVSSWDFSGQDVKLVGGNSIPSSQGSIGSNGTGSSGISELENPLGSSNTGRLTSPASAMPLPEQVEQKPNIAHCPKPPLNKPDNTTESNRRNPRQKPPKVVISCTKDSEKKVIDEMPCVFTKGDGPNGKRIEGFLFKYKKGEDVRIVCVCHGSFLTPAEFVKHAGGGDVTHPLRHIVVAPAMSTFL